MCWSFEVSLGAFIWCTLVALYIRQRRATPRDAWTWQFLLAYGQVQLCDALFWTVTDMETHDASDPSPRTVCDSFNRSLSEVALPIVLTSGVAIQLYHALSSILKKRPSLLVSMAFMIWVFTAPSRFNIYWGEPPYCTTLLEGRTLLWGDRPANKNLFWVVGGTLGFSLPFLAMSPSSIGMLYCWVGLMSSSIAYYTEPMAWGSNWCFIAVVFSAVFLVEPMLFGTSKRRVA